MKEFVKGRLTAVVDNVLAVAAVAAAGACLGLIVAFGGRSIAVEGWEVIVVAATLVGLAGALALTVRSLRAERARGGAHDPLLSLIESLEQSLHGAAPNVTWGVAERYNKLLARALAECSEAKFDGLEGVKPAAVEPKFADIDEAGLRSLVGQLRAIVAST